MTDQQLKQAQELKRIIAMLEGELEKFKSDNPAGFNVYLPKLDTLIDDVKQVFAKHLKEHNDKFKRL